MSPDTLFPSSYWTEFQISRQDVEFLHNYLFEQEVPLTTRELVPVLVEERVRAQRAAAQAKRQAAGRTYLP